MPDIQKLINKKVALIDSARQFVEEHADENGVLSAEDTQSYEAMEADITAVDTAIKRQERIDARDAAISKPTSTILAGHPGAEEKQGRASNVYSDAFWHYVRDRAISYDLRDALQIGTDSEGGYTVPDEFDRQLVQALEEENIFRRLAHVIKTSSGAHKIPIVTSKGSASWIDEEGAFSESDDAFGQTTLSAYKVGTMVKVSEELLNDSAFDLQGYIATEIARRIGAAEETAFFTGNGSGKPTGILAASGGAGTGITTAATTAITADELIDLHYSLKAPYRKNAVWLMNDSTVKAIRKLKDSQGQYLWQPSLAAGAPDMLLNRPVHTSSAMPAIEAAAKAILFGDLSYYWVADRQGRSLKRLNELYAANGQIGFLGSQRVDGKLILAEACKVLALKTS